MASISKGRRKSGHTSFFYSLTENGPAFAVKVRVKGGFDPDDTDPGSPDEIDILVVTTESGEDIEIANIAVRESPRHPWEPISEPIIRAAIAEIEKHGLDEEPTFSPLPTPPKESAS